MMGWVTGNNRLGKVLGVLVGVIAEEGQISKGKKKTEVFQARTREEGGKVTSRRGEKSRQRGRLFPDGQKRTIDVTNRMLRK